MVSVGEAGQEKMQSTKGMDNVGGGIGRGESLVGLRRHSYWRMLCYACQFISIVCFVGETK